MDYKAHYPSGEPGTHGREPFDEDSNKASGTDYSGVPAAAANTTGQDSGLSGGLGGQSGGLATDSHGGTIARDTEKRGGEVVGLGAPKDSISSSTGVGAGAGAVLPGSHPQQPSSLGAGPAAAAGGTGLVAGAGASAPPTSTHQNTGPASNTRSAGSDIDRTGNLQQDAHKYESTGSAGPTTSGAAGTDRFDTGKTGAAGAQPPPSVEQDDSHRKGTGGIGGLLSTTDKEFTANPSRTGKGAYHDESGLFKTNTAGPGGNTALTGREGTTEHNPVAQAQSRSQGGDAVAAGDSGEKKGVMDKIKDAFK